MFYFYDEALHAYMQKISLRPSPGESRKLSFMLALYRCIVYGLLILAALIVCFLYSGCSTSKEESLVERHRIETLMDRMDSVISSTSVIRQDSSWRETVLRQFQSIREHSDTSHTLVVDTAGRVIKETVVINNVRETDSQTDRFEREVLMHRLEVIDSTMNVMRQQISHSDSLLRQESKVLVREVEKPLSLWMQAQLWLGRLLLLLLLVCLVLWLLRRRLQRNNARNLTNGKD